MTQLAHNTEQLAFRDDNARLEVFRLLTGACQHLYSKGKLQMEKFQNVAPIFADIARNDPLFMAHFAVWAANGESKDMAVLAIFFNALSDADGQPFFPGSTRNKPNLREVSYALLQEQPPHLALRILQLGHLKFGVPNFLNNGHHLPRGLRRAYSRYLRFREQNPERLIGAVRSGNGNKLRQMYRLSHTGPSDEAVKILNWKQKDGRQVDGTEKALPDFSGMTSQKIAETLVETRLSPIVALGVLPNDKVTTAVAQALLGNCSGNQSIILYNWFARNGFLDVKSIKALFDKKVQEATTAVDRIETLTRHADEDDRKVMVEARAKRRKVQARTAELGRIFLHLDASISMQGAIEFAKDRSCIIAECVTDPAVNFRWGVFGDTGRELDLPDGFTKDDFHAALYGIRANMGSTDCIALYETARRFGAEVDVYITDQDHNMGYQHAANITQRINAFHSRNPSVAKPRAALIVHFDFGEHKLEQGLRDAGIPVAVMTPDTLTESALVAQSIRHAMAGEIAVIDEIMETPLPKLPNWWNSVSIKRQPKEKVAVVEV